MLGKWKKKVPCATPAAATIAFTSAPAIPDALELGDRRAEDALPRLEPSSFPRRRLDLWRHGLLFVTQILTEVNELSQSEKISRLTECRYGMARNGVM